MTPDGFTVEMGLAGGILAGAYVLIFSEVIHRTIAALLGAVVMVAAGTAFGFYSEADAIQSLDANTLVLLLGMMILIVLLRPTGGFHYLAIRIAKLAGGNPRRLLIYLGLAVSIISMFLDNVTTVLIFAPITVLITRILGINPAPFLMSEAMFSNIGGVATLVGDPPNLMIGSAAGIDFNTFIIHMAPPVAAIWLITAFVLLFLFRNQLRDGGHKAIDLDETQAIEDPAALKRVLIALGVVLALFFTHHLLHLSPAFAAFVGVALALVLVRPDPEAVFGKAEWSVLLFFAGLFILVGGVDKSGLLAMIGHRLGALAQGPDQILITCLVLMWAAALISAIVDNIPFTVTMIPIVAGLEAQGVNIMPLWWALAIGVGLGGNGTHIGATANIICVSEAEKSGIPEARITPAAWLRIGGPTMLAGLIFASLIFSLFFGFLSGR